MPVEDRGRRIFTQLLVRHRRRAGGGAVENLGPRGHTQAVQATGLGLRGGGIGGRRGSAQLHNAMAPIEERRRRSYTHPDLSAWARSLEAREGM